MNIFNISISLAIPVPASIEQIKEWVDFHLGRKRSIFIENPLINIDLNDLLHYQKGVLLHEATEEKLTKDKSIGNHTTQSIAEIGKQMRGAQKNYFALSGKARKTGLPEHYAAAKEMLALSKQLEQLFDQTLIEVFKENVGVTFQSKLIL